MSTGYFISRAGLRSRAHYVSCGKPICGVRVRLNTYQMCAAGFEPIAVECRRCQRELKRVVSKGRS